MGLNKSSGNMYDWVTHTHTHLGGICPHECTYCSVKSLMDRYPACREKYSGPLRLIEKELSVRYGSGKAIFIEHMNDLFAPGVPDDLITAILAHCEAWPHNQYIFQTKNPSRYLDWPNSLRSLKCIPGTTIETNRPGVISDVSKAVAPCYRAVAIKEARQFGDTFITIEPIMDFDVEAFALLIIAAKPSWVNIGADSKSNGLPEPSYRKIVSLVSRITSAGITVREKKNLDRLKPKKKTKGKAG